MPLKHVLGSLVSFAAYLLAAGVAVAQTPQFTIQDLGTLPNLPSCNATALSQAGNVAGYCTAMLGQNLLSSTTATHVFLYSKGSMTDLNITYPPTGAVPTGVNDSGVVVGGALNISIQDSTGSATPFIYQNGGAQPLSGPLETLLALGLNNASQMIGTSIQIGNYSLNYFVNSQAVFDPLSGGTLTDLTGQTSGGGTAAFGINSNGAVAGATVAENASNITPVLWQNLMPQLLPLLSGYPLGIATCGQRLSGGCWRRL